MSGRLCSSAMLVACLIVLAQGCARPEPAQPSAAEASRPREPNIILILTDDQGWTDTSVRMMAGREDSRSDFYRTPHLERMAAGGMVFSSAYSPAPVCGPSRHSIQFGKCPARLRNTCHSKGAAGCRDEVSIAQAVKAANPRYVTAHFGKWGLTKRTPEHAGYDASDGSTNNFHGDWRALDDKRPIPEDDPKRIFSVTRRANAFMAEQVAAGRPFYLQVSHYALHVQHYALEETKRMVRARPRGAKCRPSDYSDPPPRRNSGMIEYAAMVEDLDTGLGMILDEIDRLGIARNTYGIFTFDNGGGHRGNEPLQGGKADLWEGGIRVPMVVRGPGIRAGSNCDAPVAGWDFWATARALAGDNTPLPGGIDGGSLVPLFERGNAGVVKRGEEALVFHFPWYDGVPESAIRLGDYKLMKNLNTGETRLFNLAEDIGEGRDLSDRMPDKARELRDRLTGSLAAVGAETVEANREERRAELIDYTARDEREIRKIRARIGSAGAAERAELQKRLAHHQKMIEVHASAMERLENGKRRTWE
ncbi:MAG: sulfatase-like hydrolase/transferase [Planctomycetota bacterium]